MKKRRFSLDKEVVTSLTGSSQLSGGTSANWCVISRRIIESITLSLASLGGVSNVEPPACDCMDSDSCPPPSGGETCGEVSCGTGCTGPDLC